MRRQAGRLAEAVRQVLEPLAAAQRVGWPEGPSGEAGDGLARGDAAGRGSAPSARALVAAAEALLHQADAEAGGFGRAPKFPHATGLELLWRASFRFGHRRSWDHLVLTLERMALGGIFDQVGGGFHRYAVDRWWQVPHFEKMLYDNALLVPLYVRVGRAAARPEFLEVAGRTLDFLLDEMRVPGGGFASSLDADSPGRDGRPEEGFFYRWSPEEVREAVGDPALADELCLAFGIGPQAALHLERVLPDGPPGWTGEARTVPGHMPGQPRPDLSRFRAALARMQAYRHRHRQPPARDDKVLLGWHSLAISALVAGYQGGVGEDPSRYLRAAEEAWAFVQEHLTDPRLGLLHVQRSASQPVAAFSDDYAFLIHAALDLFRCTQDRAYLEKAAELADEAARRFGQDGVYLLSSAEHASPLARSCDVWDEATPSPNAAMAAAHARLFAYLDDPGHLERGLRVVEAAWPLMLRQVSGTAGLWCALDSLDGGAAVVSILASQLEPVREAIRRLLALPHPALEVRWQPDPDDVRFVVCVGAACREPERDLEAVLAALKPKEGS